MLNFHDIRLIFLREIRGALRERTIVFNVALVPLFMYPVFLWLAYTGFSFVVGQTENFTSRVMLTGQHDLSPEFVRSVENHEKVEMVTFEVPLQAIRNGELDLFIELKKGESHRNGALSIRLTSDSSNDRSRMAMNRIEEVVSQHRAVFLQKTALDLGLSPSEYQRIWFERENAASARDMGRFILGMMAPILVVAMIAVGSLAPALDTTAGERERSTWETTLTAATHRINVLTGKYLFVASLATTAGILNFTAMSLSIRNIMAPLIGDRMEGLAFSTPWSALPLIFLTMAFLAMFISAFLMILASFARTFKDAQSMASPFVFVIILLPAIFLQFPDLELSTGIALVPVLNVCMVFRETVNGIFHWPQIRITLLSEITCILVVLWIATQITRYEDIMSGSYEGGFLGFLKGRLLNRKGGTG